MLHGFKTFKNAKKKENSDSEYSKLANSDRDGESSVMLQSVPVPGTPFSLFFARFAQLN
jgi:hypothetical protein